MPEIVEPDVDPAANDRLQAAQRLSMKGTTRRSCSPSSTETGRRAETRSESTRAGAGAEKGRDMAGEETCVASL